MQGLIGLANLLSAMSCFDSYSKDQQENMKFTIICHLTTFSLYILYSHWQKRVPKDKWLWSSCSLADLLKYEIYNRMWLKKTIKPLQRTVSYNVSNVVFVFSMLSLDRILILLSPITSCTVLLTSRYNSTLLGHTFFTPTVFLHEILSSS